MKSLFFILLAAGSAGLCQQPQSPIEAQQKPDPVFKIGGGVSAPSLIYKVEPVYDEEARQTRIQGTVVLYVEINPGGKAVNPRVVRSLGHGLDEKAIEAVRQWKFKPGYKDGNPVTVAATIEVNFRLLDRVPTAAQPDQTDSANLDLHTNVIRLVELTGIREQLQASLPQWLDGAKAKMQQQLPNLDPAFSEEWTKRMAARLKVDDLIETFVKAYEKHFTNEDVAALIAIRMAQRDSKATQMSPELRQKVSGELTSIMGEVMGGTVGLIANLGTQVSQEISKEHPEYLHWAPADAEKH